MSLNKYSRKNNPLKPQRNPKDFVKFLCVAVLLVVVIDYGVFGKERPYAELIKQNYYAEKLEREKALEEALPDVVTFEDDGEGGGVEYICEMRKEEFALLPEKHLNITKLIPEKPVPIPQRKAKRKVVKSRSSSAAPKIAIVIDDVGMNLKQSRAAINLPADVTLAMLPYAKTVRSLAKQAKKKGHELIIHTPMEAMDKSQALGSLALRSGMQEVVFKAEFNKIAKSFDGYVGINNHMGSRLTQDEAAMSLLMEQLGDRRLFFLDSKTIGGSIAAKVARENNVPHATRDVFLDHESTPEFVKSALRKAERIARKNGSAIAIGHPKAVTMEALRKWIPDAERRGFNIVPLSRLIRHPKHENLLVKDAKIEVRDETPEQKVIVVNVEPSPDQNPIIRDHLPTVSYPVD